jgi:hypothetical protein
MAPISARTAASVLSLVLGGRHPPRCQRLWPPACDRCPESSAPLSGADVATKRTLQNELSLTPPTGASYVTYRVRMSQGQEHILSVAYVSPAEREEEHHQRVGPAVEGPGVASHGPAKSCG